MKILFIFRTASNKKAPVPFIASQMQSLQKQGIAVESFAISGKGIMAYFRAAGKLRAFLRTHPHDIIHAHYALCGLTAVLAFTGKPIVLSLMGSDILGEYRSKSSISFRSRIVMLIAWLIQPFVAAIIAKSENIYIKIRLKKIASLIPNGVDLEFFNPTDNKQARSELGLEPGKRYVLSLANPQHYWKNPGLARKAVKLLNDSDVELLTPYPVEPGEVAKYLNASDVFISTSFMEGSSNVIKEAMACNCPIVATDVGDAAWVLGQTPGCYLTSFDPDEIAGKLQSALAFAQTHNRTIGRRRIIELGLDLQTTAKRIVEVYQSLV